MGDFLLKKRKRGEKKNFYIRSDRSRIFAESLWYAAIGRIHRLIFHGLHSDSRIPDVAQHGKERI